MSPKKRHPQLDEVFLNTRLFTEAYAQEFEEFNNLPQGSVNHAYLVRFGDLAPYVLKHLVARPPTLDTQGNMIWPPQPSLKRSNAKNYGRLADLPSSPSTASNSSYNSAEENAALPGPGLKRSNAIRRTNPHARTPSPTPVPGSGLKRSGAVRKSYNPLNQKSKARAAPIQNPGINGSVWNPNGIRRSTRRTSAGPPSSGRNSKQTSPRDRMDFT